MKLANVASHSLVRYVDGLNRKAAAGAHALNGYKRASAAQHRWAIQAGLAQRAFAQDPSAVNRRALSRASQRRDQATLRAQVLASVYASAKRTGATSNVLQVLAPATTRHERPQLDAPEAAVRGAGGRHRDRDRAGGLAWHRPVKTERPRIVHAA